MSSAKKKLMLVLAVATLLCSCAGNTYLSGAEKLDPSNVAIIQKSKNDTIAMYYHIATIDLVDGVPIRYSANDFDIYVPAGRRRLSVTYKAKDKLFSFRRARAKLQFDAVGGKTFRLAFKEDLTSVSLWVEDATTGDRVSDIIEANIEVFSDVG